VEIAQVILAEQGQRAGRLDLGGGEGVPSSSARSITRTLGSPAIRGPWPESRERSSTVTGSPYRLVSSSTTRAASASSPQTMR
jgi:hypothetical protein